MLTPDQLGDAFTQYAPRIRYLALNRLRDADEADDLVAQVFVEAVQRAGSYEDRGFPVSAWLYSIARSRIADRLRRTKPTSVIDDLPIADERDELEQALAALAARETMVGLLDVLTADRQRVVELRYMEGRTRSETAAAMGRTLGEVAALQHYATAVLAERAAELRDVPVVLRRRLLPRLKRPAKVRRERLRYRGWSSAELEMLRTGYELGESNAQIARRLERSPVAVKVKAKRLGLRTVNRRTVTAREIANLLGLGCAKTVARWIAADGLEALNGGTRAKPIWRVRWDDLLSFLRRRDRWMAWDPARITDPALRAWAAELRSGPGRWLTPGEVARRCHVDRNVPNAWIARGELPATRYGNWWIWSEDLDGWTPPGERPRDWNRWHPRGSCVAHAR